MRQGKRAERNRGRTTRGQNENKNASLMHSGCIACRKTTSVKKVGGYERDALHRNEPATTSIQESSLNESFHTDRLWLMHLVPRTPTPTISYTWNTPILTNTEMKNEEEKD